MWMTCKFKQWGIRHSCHFQKCLLDCNDCLEFQLHQARFSTRYVPTALWRWKPRRPWRLGRKSPNNCAPHCWPNRKKYSRPESWSLGGSPANRFRHDVFSSTNKLDDKNEIVAVPGTFRPPRQSIQQNWLRHWVECWPSLALGKLSIPSSQKRSRVELDPSSCLHKDHQSGQVSRLFVFAVLRPWCRQSP